MTLRIQVSKAEFNSACSDGWVDGLLQGKRGLYVYLELGAEQKYISQPKDDPKTKYKMFEVAQLFRQKSAAVRKRKLRSWELGEYFGNYLLLEDCSDINSLSRIGPRLCIWRGSILSAFSYR